MANSLADTNDVLHSPNLHPVGTHALDAAPLPTVDVRSSTIGDGKLASNIGVKTEA